MIIMFLREKLCGCFLTKDFNEATENDLYVRFEDIGESEVFHA